jgi:GntR family transcriptional repressor for pyruvate dehydrogenase complex
MLSILTASAEMFLESQKLPFIRAERAMETWQEHRKILRALARRASGAAQKPCRSTCATPPCAPELFIAPATA